MALVRNVGSVDKVIRLVLGAAAVIWAFVGAGISSPIAWAALAVGAILIGTAVINFCPLFRILGISSFRSTN